jgi:hypothetical protein
VATERGAVATERGAVATERGAVATERGAVATERGAAPPIDRGPQPDGGGAERKRPWFQTGLGAGVIGAVLLAAVVVGLFAGGVIKFGGTMTTQTSMTTTHTTTTTTTRSSTTSTSKTPSSTSTATTVPATDPRPEGALTAVDNYWTDIANGKYSAAYTWDGPGVAGQSQSSFVASEQQANIQSIQFDGMLLSSSGNTATVGINTLQTVDQQNGCRNWSGQYQLTYTSGTWLISSANLTPTAC